MQEALGRLPYLIAVDTGRRTVVLAVRGTSSLSDALTDAIAQPCDLLAGWLGRRAQARTGRWAWKICSTVRERTMHSCNLLRMAGP